MLKPYHATISENGTVYDDHSSGLVDSSRAGTGTYTLSSCVAVGESCNG